MQTIRVLASTTATQGRRTNDFCFVPEGEIVTFGISCSSGTTDDECGCSRSLCGIYNKRATTTIKVIEISQEHFLAIMEKLTYGFEYYLRTALTFPTGTILEYRNGEFCSR